MENKDLLLQQVVSDDFIVQAHAFEILEKEGDISIVPDLLDIVCQNKGVRVILLTRFLADIKDTSFRGILIERIKKETSPKVKALLLQIVWASSLDFSEYADLFAHLLVEDDLIVGLEAATIIENLPRIEESVRKQITKLIHNCKREEVCALLEDWLHET
ncbi:hypothetical protein FACS1894195_4990 [Bacteroidia bacterium]|nr:hypothetical protein FACS1894195_4990 [Bacteroidia bacterium]